MGMYAFYLTCLLLFVLLPPGVHLLLKDDSNSTKCETNEPKSACITCCDQKFQSSLEFNEKTACKDTCEKQDSKVASAIAECGLKEHKGPCEQCCDDKFSGLLALADKPACKAACKLLPEKKKGTIVKILGEAAKIAECERKGHEGPCQQCCDEKFSGLLAFAEKPVCKAACKLLPDRKKRQIGVILEE